MDNAQFMRRAIALSQTKMSAGAGGPFGAVVVRRDEIIAEGWNRVTTANDPTAHAEVVAIRGACERLGTFRLDDCDIYTSCEPCPMCLAAIYWARMRTIYYGNTREDAAAIGFDDGFLYEEMNKALDARVIPTCRLLAHEAQAPFRAWQDKPDKILY